MKNNNTICRRCLKMFEPVFRKLGFWLPDELYLKVLYYLNIGRVLNLSDPRSYNEKMQWLKLYNRRLEYTNLVDKYAVKRIVSDKIGSDYIIPTLGCWDTPDKINIEILPSQFVLKTTHGGGALGVLICKDKSSFNIEKAKKKLKKALKQDIYKTYREWPYKNVKKRIIAESYIVEPGEVSPRDYKVMCFDGKVKLIEYHEGRFSEHHTQDFYDSEWNLTKITQGSYGESNTTPSPRPHLLDEMIRLSEILAKDIPHVRVDWYIVNNHLYFGELTFFDGSGLGPWDRYEDDLLMGSWITLPEKKIVENHKDLGCQGIDMFY